MTARWVPAAAWAYLLLGRGRYWQPLTSLPAPQSQTRPRGPCGPGARRSPERQPERQPARQPERWPRVAIVVPARNEAALLPHTLPTLLSQSYPGPAQVVLVDDQSSDGTAELARSLARQGGGRGLGLAVVEGEHRPPGWAGKPWAMAQGWAHALQAPEPPEWVLFTDADIAHPPESLRQLVLSALGSGKAAVSVMARLPTGTRWERLTLPAFVYFFTQIYPFRWVNDPGRETAAAAGGCLLVEADALAQAGGMGAIAGATIDDVAIAKALKASGYDIWLTLAGDGSPGQAPNVESARRYPALAGIWDMVARNAYTQLGYNPWALAGALTGLSALYLVPPLLVAVGLTAHKRATALAGLAAWAAMAASYLPTVRYYRAPPAGALALPFTCSLYMAMTLDSARRRRQRVIAPKRGPAPRP